MIIIQARSTSTRFPNKIMEKIDGIPIIQHVINNCNAALIPVIVAIPLDDPLKNWLREKFVKYYEGSEDNVLERFYHCAKVHKLEWIIRISSDSPLLSAANLLQVLNIGMNYKIDFVSNAIFECVDGQEVEFISFKLLEHTFKSATTKEDKEHVTTYIKKNLEVLKDEFKWAAIRDSYPIDKIPKMSVDTPEDLKRVIAMYTKLKKRKLLWS